MSLWFSRKVLENTPSRYSNSDSCSYSWSLYLFAIFECRTADGSINFNIVLKFSNFHFKLISVRVLLSALVRLLCTLKTVTRVISSY